METIRENPLLGVPAPSCSLFPIFLVFRTCLETPDNGKGLTVDRIHQILKKRTGCGCIPTWMQPEFASLSLLPEFVILNFSPTVILLVF